MKTYRTILSAAVIAAALGSGMAYAATSDSTTTNPDATKTVEKAERVVSDSWITTKVKSEILANSVTKAFKVSVTTRHGVVALKGKLKSQDDIDLVKSLAEKVKGVKSVDASALTVAAS